MSRAYDTSIGQLGITYPYPRRFDLSEGSVIAVLDRVLFDAEGEPVSDLIGTFVLEGGSPPTAGREALVVAVLDTVLFDFEGEPVSHNDGTFVRSNFTKPGPNEIFVVQVLDRILFDAEGCAVSDNIGTFVMEAA